MIKILVVEDEVRVADLIKRRLQEVGYKVDAAYDGQQALNLFQNNSYHMIISDIILPHISGFELCQKIRLIDKNIPILMLTALGTTDDKLEGFDAGADDYMVKPFDFRELDARIKVLLKRGLEKGSSQPSEISYSDLTINLNTKEASRKGKLIKLSPKEYNLLLFMIKNPERVLSRIEIAEKVWDTHFDTGTNFIDVYINYLRNKIDKPFDTNLIHTKPGMGFIFTDKL